MKCYFDIRTFAQTLLLALAPFAKVSASEISNKATYMYSSGGLAAASRPTANTTTLWQEILNSGGVVSNAQKFSAVDKSQPSTQDSVKIINYIDQIKSVLDDSGLEHFKHCTSYLTEDNMGIKNTKLKAGLMHDLAARQELEFKVKRLSKNACKEFFTLILN